MLQDFFSKLSEILVSEETYFLITLVEFHSWKMYCLEDINENVTSYGNHISLHIMVYRGNCKICNLFLCPNGLTDLNEIWKDFRGDDASLKSPSWEIGLGTFNLTK